LIGEWVRCWVEDALSGTPSSKQWAIEFSLRTTSPPLCLEYSALGLYGLVTLTYFLRDGFLVGTLDPSFLLKYLLKYFSSYGALDADTGAFLTSSLITGVAGPDILPLFWEFLSDGMVFLSSGEAICILVFLDVLTLVGVF